MDDMNPVTSFSTQQAAGRSAGAMIAL